MTNNNEKVRELLEKNAVPTSLEPENIKKMLEEKAPAKKRSRIKLASRITAAAAAAAVVCTGAVHFAGQKNVLKNKKYESLYSRFDDADEPNSGYEPVIHVEGAYMSGADDYSQIYKLFGEGYDRYKENLYLAGDDEGDKSFDSAVPEAEASGGDMNVITNTNGDSEDHHDTYNQEEGVIEADKAKTDGRYIYYADPENYRIMIAEAKNGSFGDTAVLDIQCVLPEKHDVKNDRIIHLNEMYVYNEMLVVIASTEEFAAPTYTDEAMDMEILRSKAQTNVLFYTTGASPELIDTYIQDGGYNSARITPEGYMYIITDYYSDDYNSVGGADNIARYIPSCGMAENAAYIPADSLLMPAEDCECSTGRLNFTVAGSIDLNTSGEPKPVDSKAMTGYTGNIYCSAENLYCVTGWGDSEITRISLSGGKITPAANGSVNGYVNDQFSMSEYGGYFRIATSKNTFEKIYDENHDYYYNRLVERDNRLYVLDMELNIVGSVTGYGLDENIKSVNFSGDMAYVVTFRQTDPLFSIDLSDPKDPKILDELKINGFSSYMQPWTDGLLLGFGSDADDSGRVTGVKLVMFDNSDPNDLREVGKYSISNNNYTMFSRAVYDRKALLISPEKNLICVPMDRFDNGSRTSYMLFSYENGGFRLKNTISDASDPEYSYSYSCFDRAVYIGDYVYLLSGNRFVSAAIDTAAKKDEAVF